MTNKNMYASKINSPIGSILIIATEHHICEITFAEKDISAMPENELTISVSRQLLDYFEGKSTTFSFPIRQAGTEFQKDVWNRLNDIQFGDTLSYAKFSEHHPLAIRAIAAANGKNNIAIAVPCHRVIGSSGKLVGYAGGLWRKKWLLQHEREVTQRGQTELKLIF